MNDYSIPDVRIADSTPSINSGQASLPQVIIAGANPAHINVRSTFYFDRSRRYFVAQDSQFGSCREVETSSRGSVAAFSPSSQVCGVQHGKPYTS